MTLIIKSYKFELKPTAEQEEKINIFFGHCRFVWNKALSENLYRLENKFLIKRYYELSFWLTRWKQSEEYGFLKECCNCALQQKLKDLDAAFHNCFKRKNGRPKFKKKGDDSFREPRATKIDNRRIYIPKIGLVKFMKSREIEGKIKNFTVSKRNGKYYVSIMVEQEIEIPKHQGTVVGIDRGVKTFVVCSDGTEYKSINAGKQLQHKIVKHQRRLAKKKKFSKNWRKENAKLNKIHNKITNIRHDHLHKSSTEICKSHAMIYLEKLKASNMTKSAKGTVEKPGKKVKAKSGLNKSILDQGWYMFSQFLEYKSSWLGGKVEYVDPKYTSQKCHKCGFIDAKNRETQSEFKCLSCGHEANADLNASKNIKTLGQRGLVCGEVAIMCSMKQKIAGNCEKVLI